MAVKNTAWANVYLNGFDHFVKRELRCPAYIRYVDDFLLFADDKATLRGWKDAILTRLARLRLSLHEPQIYPVRTGIPFLGFRIFPTHRRLKRRRGIAFQRRLRLLFRQWTAGHIPRARLDASARSWAAHAAWGDTYGLRRVVLGGFDLTPLQLPPSEKHGWGERPTGLGRSSPIGAFPMGEAGRG